MRSTYLAVISCVCALASLPKAQTAAPGASQAYRESVTGTVVSFEMVPVPGGTVTVAGKPVRSEAVLHRTHRSDVGSVRRLHARPGYVRRAGGRTRTPIARPSSPYGAPDYGWGHAGFPAISVAIRRRQSFAGGLSAKTGTTIACRRKPSGPRGHARRRRGRREGVDRRGGLASGERDGANASGRRRRRPTPSACSICSATSRNGSRRAAGLASPRAAARIATGLSPGPDDTCRPGRNVERARPSAAQEPLVALGRPVRGIRVVRVMTGER